ncbi:CoA transferase [Thiomonas sp.]|uniref:CoA transferase n=1 Tax=Thiomonas sp. TaxID=2047785 RepID=UPI00262798FC|nr:CoA transferase [Thiomonas sp.]
MDTLAHALSARIWDALGGDPARLARLSVGGEGAWPGLFPVSDLAAAAVACAALAADELRDLAGTRADTGPGAVQVDRRLAAAWFGVTLQPLGWAPPPLRDALTGDWRCRDGWIRLHANAPHHRAAALDVLGLRDDPGQVDEARVAAAVASWHGASLERAVVEAGGCAAEMRDIQAWRAHPQGIAVQGHPLVEWRCAPASAARWNPRSSGLLRGLRVLDMTRVLAGPVATRMLAGLGATVLRIDPPQWNEPGVVADVTRGKRCARLDLKTAPGHARFVELLAQADVFVHGLRPGALDALGLDARARTRIRPGLVDVSLDAYGWHGPWASRRGFDSLVQMSCGIADAGMRAAGAKRPLPLPVQALDHSTGYLAAAAVLRGLTRRVGGDQGTEVQLSLAATAEILLDLTHRTEAGQAPHAPLSEADWLTRIERTPWGPARRLRAPWGIAGVPTRWHLPAAELGSAPARW